MATGGKGFTFQFFDALGTTSSVSSFTVPAGVTKLILIGCGGGGGGQGGHKAIANVLPYGGFGCVPSIQMIDVIPGTTYNVIVGGGGTGGAGRTSTGIGNPGNLGGDTLFGNLALFKGAYGGSSLAKPLNSNGNVPISSGVSLPTIDPGISTYFYANGPFNVSGPSGIWQISGSNYFFGGSGGGSGYGDINSTSNSQGGAGGPARLTTNGDPGSSGGISNNYGAGGGAGGSTNSGASSGAGGNGAPGMLFVMWVEA